MYSKNHSIICVSRSLVDYLNFLKEREPEKWGLALINRLAPRKTLYYFLCSDSVKESYWLIFTEINTIIVLWYWVKLVCIYSVYL